ncbi:porin [Ectothiorhodospira variabilis]|uniref:porin n=1 Tax=Ectothiorhodospira variabilis TaxID=505694 RepID=UPI001EFA34E3|nr:porin [Ectothiorhodospira variabilis]MCG5494432.1 porin [Ectothiorhodospira variabilis]MCG5498967.1 porin [Ectothiorhodospira variabilis]MCG5503197.1 porin [Ectothiorhodospira variabilis]MCG5506044.1 porin [Ectothiorhodospira variabilis]
MKKTVLAFAVAAAVGVPAAAAADTTLYGRLNVSLDFVDNGEDSSHQLASNSSRLGVRGSEDLGFAGLRGVYQIEGALQGGNNDAAFDGSSLTARNTYLGLAGDFGELRLGKHDTPYKMSTLRLNFFADTLGDMHHVASRTVNTAVWISEVNAAEEAGLLTQAQAAELRDDLSAINADSFYNRLDNTIVYMSPDFDGFRIMGSYTTDLNRDRPDNASANDRNAFSLAASFEQGPMYVTVAYEQLNETVGDDDAKAWKVGGTYQIQDLTLAAMYENIDLDFDDRDLFHIGAKYQLGQAYLMGSYTHAGDLDEDDGAKMYALGAGYDFTRRTGMYAVYARVNNDDFGTYGLNGSGKGKGVAPAAFDENVSGFQVGVTHNF